MSRKHPKFFKFIPWKERNILLILLAIIAAGFFYIIAGLMWYLVVTGSIEPVYWVSALLTTIGGLCSTMTIITGEGAWMLIGLFEW